MNVCVSLRIHVSQKISIYKYMRYVIQPDREGMIADEEMSLKATENHEVMEVSVDNTDVACSQFLKYVS